jgi:pentatricopeptide repeat protein
VEQIEPALLRDPSWVVAQVVPLCRTQVKKAVEVYDAARRAGMDLRQVPTNDFDQMFTALATSTIRVGLTEEALRLLRDLRSCGLSVSGSLFVSLTKLCTSKQLFSECLAIYDFVSEDRAFKIDDKAVWSCLLFCATEAKSYHRCTYLFDGLKKLGTPSHKDFGNMIRFASVHGDWQLCISIVQEMRAAGAEIDSIVYNTALATCVASEQLPQARSLLEEMNGVGGIADAITYNTLMKGHAKAGQIEQCFEIYELMRTRKIVPSQVTYGILLDGCINDNQVDRAAEVFKLMTEEGCEMNTVLYTTLIKGFARNGQVDEAMKIYDQMRTKRNGVPPDLITFSILIKANCDACRLNVALKLLEAMLELGLKPDEVVFNNLLGGCVKDSNAELARRLYQSMVETGIKPSSATFSILIRLYAQCKLLDEAVDMLRNEPQAQGVVPEPRLFSQLAQCCLRERQGRRTVEVYKMMLGSGIPSPSMHNTLLGTCVKLNMLDTAVEILDLAAATKGVRVDALDANAVLEAARRKKKAQCIEACSAAMLRMGLAQGPPRPNPEHRRC